MIAALPLITSAVSSVLGSSQAASAAQASKAASSDFSSVLGQVSNNAINKLNTSETLSVAGISGKATTQSVVEAVMSAQEALQTAVAVRDKAVAAFQEVTRMAI